MSKYKIILLVIFILALVWSGIRPPASQQYWLLENSPLFLAILVFVLLELYFKLKISNFSYTLIVLYLILPLIASHYGVTGVSFGEILGNWIGSTRNMYDRLTHFAFGFLGFYPVYEFVVSVNKKESLWNYYIPLETIMMFSAIYEIFEWMAAVTVNPVLAASFYGSQGDVFDTQKDMAMAGLGALSALILVFLFQKYKNLKKI